MNCLIYKTAAEQAEYVDQICQHNATDPDFAEDQLETKFTPEKWNITSLGNVAYMSLHAPTPKLREQYELERQLFIEWKSSEHKRMILINLGLGLLVGTIGTYMCLLLANTSL